MNTKRLLIGTVVAAVVLYFGGMLIWQILFADFFDANSASIPGVDRDSPILWAVIVSSVLYGLLVTLAIESRSGASTLVGGLVAGAVIGVLGWGTADFIFYGFTHLNNLTATVADTLLEGVHGGIAGAVTAFVLGKVGD